MGLDLAAEGLESLARIHGALWGSPRLDNYAWLQTSLGTPADTEQMQVVWSTVRENLADPELQHAFPKFVRHDPLRLVRV
jgi:hypothetical protein